MMASTLARKDDRIGADEIPSPAVSMLLPAGPHSGSLFGGVFVVLIANEVDPLDVSDLGVAAGFAGTNIDRKSVV